ncbi:MAG: diguanylate cyclase domain-containing protein [Colwellia sp.]
MNTPFDINNQPLVASISIGIAAYPEHGKSVAELIRNADTAMYDAKRQGKGYCCYSEL